MQMAEQHPALSNVVTPEHLAELSTHTTEKHKKKVLKNITQKKRSFSAIVRLEAAELLSSYFGLPHKNSWSGHDTRPRQPGGGGN